MREGREYYFFLVALVTVAFLMAPATAGTAAFLCSRLRDAGVPAAAAAQVSVLCGLGTPLLYRAAHLNHNLLVADAGFTALLLLWDPAGRPLRPLRALLAGALAGFSILCDYSGIVVVVMAGIYAWFRSAKDGRFIAAYAAGLLPFVAGLAIYQAWAFGSLLRPSQHYMTPTVPTSRGYRGFDWPSPALLWANFFDPRFGLFAYCPALLLAFAAPFTRVRFRVPALETRVLFGYFALFVLFCSANQYSWFQPLTGFRYLVPVVPALALLAIQAAEALPRGLKWLIAGASCAQSLIMAAGHENNLQASVSSLIRRRFRLPWMVRMSEMGISVTDAWPIVACASVIVIVALIWWRGAKCESA